MRLNQFQYLLSLAEHGSFSKAAQELFVHNRRLARPSKKWRKNWEFLFYDAVIKELALRLRER